MAKVAITSDQTVGAIMRRWPGTAAVFLTHRMACVGCPMARFDTVAEAAAEYAVPLARLLGELEAAAGRRSTVPSPRRCGPGRGDRG